MPLSKKDSEHLAVVPGIGETNDVSKGASVGPHSIYSVNVAILIEMRIESQPKQAVLAAYGEVPGSTGSIGLYLSDRNGHANAILNNPNPATLKFVGEKTIGCIRNEREGGRESETISINADCSRELQHTYG